MLLRDYIDPSSSGAWQVVSHINRPKAESVANGQSTKIILRRIFIKKKTLHPIEATTDQKLKPNRRKNTSLDDIFCIKSCIFVLFVAV